MMGEFHNISCECAVRPITLFPYNNGIIFWSPCINEYRRRFSSQLPHTLPSDYYRMHVYIYYIKIIKEIIFKLRSKCIFIIILHIYIYICTGEIFSEYRRIVITYLTAVIIYSCYKLELRTPKYTYYIIYMATSSPGHPAQNARALFDIALTLNNNTHYIFKSHI